MDQDMSNSPSSSSGWRSPYSRHMSTSSSVQGSDTESILISFVSPLTSPISPTISSPQIPTNSRPASVSTDQSTHLDLNTFVTLSFVKGNRSFKLRYPQIDIYRSVTGDLKWIELNDYSRAQGSLVHTFPNSRQAVPHLERPAASETVPLRVSFLGTQQIQTTQTLFSAEPCYTFDNEQDCLRFQQALLQQQVILVAGVTEINSKGRGEECISQNFRILRAQTGAYSMIFFANSQRREKKRYVCIPLSAVDRIVPGKRGSKAIALRLRPSLDLLAQLKQLQIKFLAERDYRTFNAILCQVVGLHGDG